MSAKFEIFRYDVLITVIRIYDLIFGGHFLRMMISYIPEKLYIPVSILFYKCFASDLIWYSEYAYNL